MSGRTAKLRALYLACLLSLAVFAGATTFGGSAAAATINSGGVSVGNSPSVDVPDTATIDPSSGSKIPVAINVTDENVAFDDVELRTEVVEVSKVVNVTSPGEADFDSGASTGTVTLPTSVVVPYNPFTLNVTAYDNSTGTPVPISSGADDTSTGGVTIDDTTPPAISGVTLDEKPNGDVTVSFVSSEQLGTSSTDVTVTVDGPTTQNLFTFDGEDISPVDASAPFTYQLKPGVERSFDDGEGMYTATVDDAVDPGDNNGGENGAGSDLSDTVTISSDFSSKTITHVGGSGLNTANIDMFTTKFENQFAFVMLENDSASFERRDLSGEGADATTQLWVNFTVDDFNPDVLVGTANVDSWDYTMNGDGSANVNVSLRPASTERNFTAWKEGVNDPSSWDDKYEGSDLSMDAVVDFGLGNLSGGAGGGPQGLDGARLTTDAQAFTVPKLNENDNLTVDVASPHCVADAAGSPTNDCSGEDVNDGGFYEAVVPPEFYQQEWDVDELSAGDVDVTYSSDGSASSGTEWDISVRQDGALVINGSNIHYSEGTVNIGETGDSSTASNGGGGGGDGTIATTVTTERTDDGTTATIERVAAEDLTVPVAIENAETGTLSVREAIVTFGAGTNSENTMMVTASTAQPAGIPTLQAGGSLLGYVTVDVDGPLADDVVEGSFTLDITGSEVDPDDVTAHRYDGSEWEPVAVEPQGDGTVKVISENGFSPFAIGASETAGSTSVETGGSGTSATPTDAETPTPTPLPDVGASDATGTVEVETSGPAATAAHTTTPGADGPGFGFTLGALALVLAVGFARLRR